MWRRFRSRAPFSCIDIQTLEPVSMKIRAVLAACAGLTVIAGSGFALTAAHADDVVPCEKSLADLRAALEKATVSDADKAQVKALEDKGIERCNADDDKRADDFFAQAMKILGK
jgi:hypothetical protein